ncbi:hypothetical protein [Streptomyces aureoverticillatus]|uniref:hypothetical protein n=1 Tax=Streptomyces aureoverticillatus TaxID=66871 RepID=UPI0013D9549C|nr:hypothetical protein [Streptomyces aureoverticillatus]QIB43986.1 hypothetical protein G3H79_13745 [Streptomyces aureoverticillatus]
MRGAGDRTRQGPPRRTARRLAAAGVTAVGVLLALLLCAPQAAAGGSTSVLLTSPESAETASLYNGREKYAELETLLGPTAKGESEQPPGLSLGATRQINVTWLIHDVRPWRVDRVYPEPSAAKGAAIWIHTATDTETMSGYWHRSPNPSALRSLLKDLGLMGKPADGERSHPGIRPSDAGTSGRDTAAGDGPAGGSSSGGDSGWRWAIPSAAAGAVAGAGALHWFRRRTQEEPPGQELIDT